MFDLKAYIRNANGKQPEGELGSPPGPNGRVVATKPGLFGLPLYITPACPEGVVIVTTDQRVRGIRQSVDALRPEDV